VIRRREPAFPCVSYYAPVTDKSGNSAILLHSQNRHTIYSFIHSFHGEKPPNQHANHFSTVTMTVLSPATAAESGQDAVRVAVAVANRRCMFLCLPCFPSETSSATWWQDLLSPANKERWWYRRWRTVRDWKTFVRRFNNYYSRNHSKRHGSFRYDPLSYALNFDDGTAAEDDGHCYKGFSERFASVPQPEKSSVYSSEEHAPPVLKLEKWGSADGAETERAVLLIVRFFLFSFFVLFCCILRKLGRKQNEHHNNTFICFQN